jgi:hypothetical protein
LSPPRRAIAFASADNSQRERRRCASNRFAGASSGLDETVAILEVIDEARRQIGVRYDADEEN